MNNNFSIYLEKFLPKPLTVEEEIYCLLRVREGDESAKKKLCEHNLRLIVYIIKTRFNSLVNDKFMFDMDDIISVGTIGLIKAINAFKLEKNVRFPTYAATVITNEIIYHIKKNIKNNSNYSFDQLNDMGANKYEYMFSDSSNTIEDNYLLKEEYQLVSQFLQYLTPIEREIIELHYGFRGKIYSCREIGEILGFSAANISKIDIRVRRKMESYLESKRLVLPRQYKKTL